jgi:hypothetical protein
MKSCVDDQPLPVFKYTTDNAIGGQNTTTYKYGKAKVNIKGRGNLGFGWIEKWCRHCRSCQYWIDW